MPDYSIGDRVQLLERMGRVINARTEAGRTIRLKTEDAIVRITPTWETENIDPGTLVGASIAALSAVLDDSPTPLGSDTEIVDTEVIDGGVRYKVNVDSAFRNQGRFKAMMESGTGFTSLITDRFDVEEEDALKERPVRDTWQYKIVVDEKGLGEEMDRGFGLI